MTPAASSTCSSARATAARSRCAGLSHSLCAAGLSHIDVVLWKMKNNRGLSWRLQGLHSWIQFHLEERNGNLEYRGYLNPHRLAEAPLNVHTADVIRQ